MTRTEINFDHNYLFFFFLHKCCQWKISRILLCALSADSCTVFFRVSTQHGVCACQHFFKKAPSALVCAYHSPSQSLLFIWGTTESTAFLLVFFPLLVTCLPLENIVFIQAYVWEYIWCHNSYLNFSHFNCSFFQNLQSNVSKNLWGETFCFKSEISLFK